jgi:uncharacterized membrane protein YkvA (DUF1232 family)
MVILIHSMFKKLWQSFVSSIKKLKLEIFALVVAYSDSRTPITAKLVIALTVGYFFSPIDLIPDFIPIFGSLDDLLIVPSLVWLAIKLLPPIVLAEAREKVINKPPKISKNNWLFAMFIILIWIILAYFLASWFFQFKLF